MYNIEFYILILPPRFGWFLPESFASNAPPIKDHWRAFTTSKVAKLFAPASAKEKNYIYAQMKNEDNR